MNNLTRNALILDTETTGLTRGSGIHELAIYDLKAQELHEVFLRPNLVRTHGDPLQERTRLASSASDVHMGVRALRWRDLLQTQLQIEGRLQKQATEQEYLRALRVSNPFLYRAIEEGKYPHLEGPVSPQYLHERERQLGATPGMRRVSSQVVDIEDALGSGGLLDKMLKARSQKEGLTIWGANIAFEAKQIGAHVASMGADHVAALKSTLETRSAGADPFYVTGGAVNRARVQAQLSGDWTLVYKSYLENQPKAGETAVRDVQDVLRAMNTYASQIGISGIKDPYAGTSMDVTSRLFGSLDQDPVKALAALTTPEVHRAAEDTVLTADVLEKTLHYTEVLRQVKEGTDVGEGYKRAAVKGEGPLAEISRYFARLEKLLPTIDRVNLAKRVARAEEDFLSQSKTFQRTGIDDIAYMRQETPAGTTETVPRLVHARTAMDRAAFVEFLKKEGRYADQDIDEMMGDLGARLSGTPVEQQASIADWLESKTAGVLDAKIAADAEILLNTESRQMGSMVSRWGATGKALTGAVDGLSQMKLHGRSWAPIVAAGLTAVGGAWSMTMGNKVHEQPKSLVSFNYYDWLAHQTEQEAANEFYGTRSVQDHMEGLGHTGVAAQTRSIFTDFSSPYAGIQGSQLVFHDQELLREREKYIRESYVRSHYDPEVGLFGVFGPFSAAKRKGYTMMGRGTAVQEGIHSGLKNADKLLELDLSEGNWKVTADDADTIVVQRGGLRGAVSSFFGMNKRYQFRLEGIDSTEVTHGAFSADGGQYHAPQPFAEEAGGALRQLLANKKLKLIYNPTDSSYGRQLAVLYADGKNVNVEAVRQGYAAFLPYNKREESIIDWDELERAQAGAMASGKGMWSQPWAQVYGEFSKAGHNSITFNTFTRKEKLAQNTGAMDLLSLMEQAQAQGFMSTAQATEAARLASVYNTHGDERAVKPAMFNAPSAHYDAYMGEMLRNLGTWNKTHGTGDRQNHFKSRGAYGKLDKALVLDSMSSTDSMWSKRKYQAFERYPSRRDAVQDRRARQAESQRQINQQFFNSPINHHVM